MPCKHGNFSMNCGWCEDQAELREKRKEVERLKKELEKLRTAVEATAPGVMMRCDICREVDGHSGCCPSGMTNYPNWPSRSSLANKQETIPGGPTLQEDGWVSLDWSVRGMALTMNINKTGEIVYAWRTPGHIEPSGHGTLRSHPAVHEVLSAVIYSR